MQLDPRQLKEESEGAIRKAGGQVLATLPEIGVDELSVRSSAAVAERALVLNVLIQMSFGAPPSLAHAWLSTYGLLPALSGEELTLFAEFQP